MSNNGLGHDDEVRQEQIDRLIRTGERSDDSVANALRDHVPQPRPDYVRQLARELFEASSDVEDHRGVKTMTAQSIATRRLRPQAAFPLTAAATFAGVLLTIALITAQWNRPQPPVAAQISASTSSATATATHTHTPTPLPTPTFVPTATPTASFTFTPTHLPLLTTLPPGQFATAIPLAGAETDPLLLDGVIFPTAQLRPVSVSEPVPLSGDHLILYVSLQHYIPGFDPSVATFVNAPITDRAVVLSVLDYAGEYVITYPESQSALIQWLFANDAVFYYAVVTLHRR
jgi:hypothetical protein